MSFVLLAALLGAVLVVASLGTRIARVPRMLQERTFSNEYTTYIRSYAWKKRRKRCLQITLGRDAVIPLWQATDIDHLHYRNLGRELPWVDIIPLNWRTHKFITAARLVLGRPFVNTILRAFFAIWFAIYVAPIALVLIVVFPAQARIAVNEVELLFHYVTLLHV